MEMGGIIYRRTIGYYINEEHYLMYDKRKEITRSRREQHNNSNKALHTTVNVLFEGR